MDVTTQNLPVFCMNAVALEDTIRNKYQEVPVLSMRTNAGDGAERPSDLKEIEVWYNPTTGTATVTIRPFPDIMCVVIEGNTKPKIKGQPL